MEDLGRFKDAYSKDFKFIDESTASLNWYSKRMCSDMRFNKYSSLLSLGIGRRIVSLNLANELNYYLKRHIILEGSSEIIASFKKQHEVPKQVEIIETFFEDFKTDERFDAIEGGFVLEHVDDPAIVINRIKKYLKPGGKMYLAVPNARSLHRVLGYEAGLLDNCYKLSNYDLSLGHKRYYDLETFSKLVLDCGLMISRIEGIFLKPLTNDQLSMINLDPQIWEALFKIGVHYPEISNSIYIEAIL